MSGKVKSGEDGPAAVRKDSIRKELRSVRASMDCNQWELGSGAIARKAFQLEEFRAAAEVMIYLAMEDRREVDTAPLIAAIASAGQMKMFAPSLCGENLCAVPYREGVPLVRGSFGQPEPLRVNREKEVFPDIVVVPVVAVDRTGNRLGYGKGYYDRFIASLRKKGKDPFVVGLAFSFQLLEFLPEDAWDEKLDCIVTEKEVLRFN